MSDAKAAWEEVGSTFSGLGMKLKLHFEQARSEDGEPAGSAGPGGSTAEPSAQPTAGGDAATGPAYAPPSEPGAPTADPTGEEATSGGSREDVKEALRKLGAAIDDAFEALGSAAKDQAIKDDVRHVGQSLTGALSATFADVSDDLRKAFRRNKE